MSLPQTLFVAYAVHASFALICRHATFVLLPFVYVRLRSPAAAAVDVAVACCRRHKLQQLSVVVCRLSFGVLCFGSFRSGPRAGTVYVMD